MHRARRAGPGVAGFLVATAVIVALVYVASVQPPLAAAALVLPFIPFYLRHLPVIALALLTSAPILLSSFSVGSLTLDNVVTLAGIVSAVLWALQTHRVSLPALSVFPILMAVAIAISGVFAGVPSAPGVIRFVGMAFVPALVLSGAVSRRAAEIVIFTALAIGALSVITQPFDPFVAPYIDPQTGDQRYGGLMGHPNFAAYAIGLGILYLLDKGRLRAWQWITVATFAFAILMTSSIAALATVAAAGLVILFRRGVLRGLAVTAAGLIGVVALGDTLLTRVDALTSGDQNLNSVGWRLEQWSQAIDLVKQQWLTGIGWQQVPNRIADGLEAHSAYVEVWVELGLVGSVLAVIGVVVLFNSAGGRLLPLLLLAVVVVSSITDPVIVYPSSLATLLTLLACEQVGVRAGRADRPGPLRDHRGGDGSDGALAAHPGRRTDRLGDLAASAAAVAAPDRRVIPRFQDARDGTMRPVRVGIVGAGASGLVTARVLREFGHEVTVYESAPDVGGVWSATRRYPGISTQDDRTSYAFSERVMPAHYPLHPAGAQVQAYLEDYSDWAGIASAIRLNTRVTSIQRHPVESAGEWTVRSEGPLGTTTDVVDVVVMANGNFSVSHVPAWPGRELFEEAGGQVVAPTLLGDGVQLEGRRVSVIGWGKTACDVAAASASIADETTIVARVLRWKHPKHIGKFLTFRHLILTRLGEHLLAAPHRSLAGRALARLDAPVRRAVDRAFARRVAGQLRLDELGLRPRGPYADSNALVTEDFFEAVADGRLSVRRDVQVVALDGTPGMVLSDGSRIATDVIVPATGFEQVLDPLSSDVQRALLDDRGVLRLHRGIVPAGVPGLAFIGWMHSFHSPLTAELQALWLAHHLATGEAIDSPDELDFALTHERAAATGVSQLPAISFGLLDLLLTDLGVPLPRAVRLRQVLTPLDPRDYAGVLPRLRARVAVSSAVDTRERSGAVATG